MSIDTTPRAYQVANAQEREGLLDLLEAQGYVWDQGIARPPHTMPYPTFIVVNGTYGPGKITLALRKPKAYPLVPLPPLRLQHVSPVFQYTIRIDDEAPAAPTECQHEALKLGMKWTYCKKCMVDMIDDFDGVRVAPKRRA